MIIKYFNLQKELKNINYYLLYGPNTGLIEEIIDKTLKPFFISVLSLDKNFIFF